jgi:hypothetical protein
MTKSTIVISAARFGANYFLDLYGQSRPDDIVLYEIFRKGSDSLKHLTRLLERETEDIRAQVASDPAALWRDIRQAAATRNRGLIAKAYYYHQPRDSALWPTLAGDSRVIHLMRRNLFEGFLSRKIAMQTGHWSVRRTGDVSPASLTIDPGEARKYIRARQHDIDWCRATFGPGDYHELYFEDITLSPRRCVRAIAQVFPEFGPLPLDLHSNLAKIKSVSNADIVANYPEVAHLDLPLA